MADSDLALAMAIADNSDSSQDDDFQLPTHAKQLCILHTIAHPPKRQKKSHCLSSKQRVRLASMEGKENHNQGSRKNPSGPYPTFENPDLSQVRRPLAPRKPNVDDKFRTSADRLRGGFDKAQNGKCEATPQNSQRQTDGLDQPSNAHPTVASSASTGSDSPLLVQKLEDNVTPDAFTCTQTFSKAKELVTDQQETSEAVPIVSSRSSSAVQGPFYSPAKGQKDLSVVNMEKTSPFVLMDEVISLAEEDDLVVDVIEQKQQQFEPDCIQNEIIPSTGYLSSANVNSDSQLNALLSLCVYDGDEEGDLRVNSLGDNLGSEDSSFAVEEIISSIMTQNKCGECVVPSDVNLQYSDHSVTPKVVSKGATGLHYATQKTYQEARTMSSKAEDGPNHKNFDSDGKPNGERSGLHFESNIEHSLECPVCGDCIAALSLQQREIHTNACLDKMDTKVENTDAAPSNIVNEVSPVNELGRHERTNEQGSGHVYSTLDLMPVLRWLETLNLSRYADVFVREEIDWDTLNCLTDEDLISLGITAFGPRRKILHALQQGENARLKRSTFSSNEQANENTRQLEVSMSGKKLITEFFELPSDLQGKASSDSRQGARNMDNIGKKCTSGQQKEHLDKEHRGRSGGQAFRKSILAELAGIPEWMSIPGTKFRVDAFQYLRADCSHWFLTHFHTDHYQGLTRGFRYGHVYCSSITAQLVHMRIGVPWERLKVLPLEQTIEIDHGVKVTFIDANHCPGSVMILFQPQNGKTVLHTGDFRFSEVMVNNPVLRSLDTHTLILDTTYCNPQYDFPSQEVVIQFIIDAIQAEAFNPSTLFLIGTYTIGKERIFFDIAKALQTKVYCSATKLRLLQCMNFPEEDMKWLTTNDGDSNIHVVALWSVASFKRMNYVVRQNVGRYNSIVSFSPTGWSFGRGKKRTPGRRWRQGTIVRYEVPYSEHCSFKELRDFVRFINPSSIVPSVHNDSAQAADALIALLLNDEQDC